MIVATANHFLADAFLGALHRRRSPRWPRPRWPAPAAGLGVRAGEGARLMADPQTTSRPPAPASAPCAHRRASARREHDDATALIESRLTPNAISLTGLVLCVVAAVLVWQELFFLGGIAFIVGSVCDTLDGRYSRMSGKGTPFGAFLDSTLDRIEEGIVLTAVAAVLRRRRATRSPPRRPSSRCSRR